jgi:cytochrome b
MGDGLDNDKLRVWDLPTRLFKWTLVVLVVFQVITGKLAGDWLVWHFRSGYAILALLIFRVLWGFVGSTTARFTDFVKGPVAGLAHLRDVLGKAVPRETGHNAIGGWMVVVLILALMVQVVSGLFTTDDIATDGPLVARAGESWVRTMTSLHHRWIYLLYVLVGLHVLAAVFYLLVKRQNLIGAMITGRKKRKDVVPPGSPAPSLRFANNVLAAACLAVSAAIVYGVVTIGG